MSITLRWFIAVAAVLAFAAPVSAQQIAFTDAVHEPVIEASEKAPAIFNGPTTTSAALMAPLPAVSFDAMPAAFALRQRASRDVALMVVGGAGLVVGSLVGGDAGTVIMIGGGTVALVGLYRYLR